MLVTIDAALGPFNGPAVRYTTIPENVKINHNYITKTPQSRVGSQGMIFKAKNPDTTQLRFNS